MDFIDEVRQFSARAQSLVTQIATEEATKHSLILPFIQLLGYNVFDPSEVVPEFTADVGTKKGEKVDYAIIMGGRPMILIEAKCCTDSLANHDSQLFRYFSATEARFAVLTNGLSYKFFSDLKQANKMDSEPFLEFNVLDPKETVVAEVKKFHKENFDADDLFSTACNLQYSTRIAKLMDRELKEPCDDFLRFVLHEIYPGKVMPSVLSRFRPLIKKALNQYVSELIGERLKSAIQTMDAEKDLAAGADTPNIPLQEGQDEPGSRIVTTDEELEAFYIVKAILHGAVDPGRITYKDTVDYLGVLLDANPRKWICRLYLSRARKRLVLPPVEGAGELSISIQSPDDLFQHAQAIIDTATRTASRS